MRRFPLRLSTSPGGTLAPALALALCAASPAAQPETTPRTAVVEELRSLVRAAAGAAELPGVTAAVRWADGEEWSEGFGLQDLENGVPATERTVYRLASISKPITAVAALRLVERGVLDLDADVGSLVPEWPAKTWTVTPRDLLGHLGGVRHYEGRSEELHSNRHYTGVRPALAVFAADPLLHEPGTRYHYTTYGYNLLGAALEGAARQPFAALLGTEVFEPAGCTTLQVDDSRRLIPHRAQGYRRIDGVLVNAAPVDTSNKVPGGGLCGTALDLVRFAGALCDGRLVSPTTRERMWTSMRTTAGEETGYGMGFRVTPIAGRASAWHSGAQPRVSTLLVIDRTTQLSVALMCNLEGQGAVLRSLAARLVAAACGAERVAAPGAVQRAGG